MKERAKIKKQLVEYGRKIAHCHLVMGPMGNTSVRDGNIIWIKRSGAWFEKTGPGDFVAVDFRSAKALRRQLPSKELLLHLGCYNARGDINAVVHTHPVMATALATAGVPLDTPELYNKIASKSVILPYYPPGSKRLANEVQRAIKKSNAVILANHGLVTVGSNIREAYQRTLACEKEAGVILAGLRK